MSLMLAKLSWIRFKSGRLRLLVVVGLSLLAGSVMSFLVNRDFVDARDVLAEDDFWALPTARTSELAAWRESLKRSNAWPGGGTLQAAAAGGAGAAGGAALSAVEINWQFLGIVTEGRLEFGLLMDPSDSKVIRVSRREALADGTQVAAMTHESITLQKQEVSRTYVLYQDSGQ